MTDSSPSEQIPPKKKRQKKTATADRHPDAMTPIDGQIILPVRPATFVAKKHVKEIVDWPGKHGPKALRFSAETRKLVRDLAMWGITHENICKHVLNPRTGEPLDHHTLTKYFPKELLQGELEGDRVVSSNLFEMVRGRPREFLRDQNGNVMFDLKGSPIVTRDELKPMPAPAIFQSKVRRGIGFAEKVTIEHKSSQMKELSEALTPLDETDLLQLKAILAKRVESQQSDDRARRLPNPTRGRKGG